MGVANCVTVLGFVKCMWVTSCRHHNTVAPGRKYSARNVVRIHACLTLILVLPGYLGVCTYLEGSPTRLVLRRSCVARVDTAQVKEGVYSLRRYILGELSFTLRLPPPLEKAFKEDHAPQYPFPHHDHKPSPLPYHIPPPITNPISSIKPGHTPFPLKPPTSTKMHLPTTTTLFSLLLTVLLTLPLTSAWAFHGYSQPGFNGEDIRIVRNFPSTAECFNISEIEDGFDNRMSSFIWNPEAERECGFRLYDLPGCTGAILAESRVKLNEPAMDQSQQHMASAFWLSCVVQ